jgi:uncharacterized protein YjbI with pentapeptide repeats/MinD-like ATPase involved in chromosome partitioning or flagellar assembly
MEVIAFASGKGGTGKTLMAACFGYALIRAGHRVLMIDCDPATDGLSLFLLGPKGIGHMDAFEPANTFVGILRSFQESAPATPKPHRINRSGSNAQGDHGITYDAIISGRGLYGDESFLSRNLAVPDLSQEVFRQAIAQLVRGLKEANEYDYVIADTRGGFAFESTDVCALADSFIVVTEPDITSFYQDRNLVRRIGLAADQVGSRPLLRSMIVNKATEIQQTNDKIDLTKIEWSFRDQLMKEFPLKIEDTHSVPVDVEALKAYKTQRIPYLEAPASLFSFATLSAFSDILQLVTATERWTLEQINGWNVLVQSVSEAVAARNKQVLRDRQDQERCQKELLELRQQNAVLLDRADELKREIQRTERLYERNQQVQSTSTGTPLGTQATTSSALKRRFLRAVVSAAILVIVSVSGFWAYRLVNQYRADDLVAKIYNTSLPAPIRFQYLNQLRSTYHRQNFDDIDLQRADLHGLNLRGLSFYGANFTGASLASSDLTSAVLSNANMSGADLSFAQLSNAKLQSTVLRDANLQKADLSGADLRYADFSGANLSGATVDPSDLGTARTNNFTILPDGTMNRLDRGSNQAPISGTSQPFNKLFVGNWSATTGDLSKAFGGEPNGCVFELRLSGLYLSIRINAKGLLENADLRFVHNEEAVSKGCESTIPPNIAKTFQGGASQIEVDKVEIEFRDTSPNPPLISATFNGQLDDTVQPPVIRGILNIVRIDQPAKFTKFNWQIEQTIVLRQGLPSR